LPDFDSLSKKGTGYVLLNDEVQAVRSG